MTQTPVQLRPLLDELPPDAARHIEEAISSSPMLVSFMSAAVEQGLVTKIRLSPESDNLGGKYAEDEKAIYINERDFLSLQRNDDVSKSQLHDRIVATLGHETSHAFDAKSMGQASRRLDGEIEDRIRAAGGSEQREVNLTGPVREYLNIARDGEAKAERAGWNALASRIYEQNEQELDVDDLLRRSGPTTGCVTKVGDGSYALANGISLDERGYISANQREAVAQCHFDASGHSLGQAGNASYRNYYATYAIERIEEATRHWRNPPEVRLDMQHLGLDHEQIRGAGLNFGKLDRSVSILDPATGVLTFEHNRNIPSRSAPDHSLAVDHSPPTTVISALRASPFASSTHPDHALYRNVKQSLQSQLPPGAEVSEDRLAQLTVAAKEARFRPDEPISIALGETTVSLRGEYLTHRTIVDLASPVPPALGSAGKSAEPNQEQARWAEYDPQQQTPVMQR